MTTTDESNSGRLSTADFAAAADHRDETPTQLPTDQQPVQPRREDQAAQPSLFKGNDGEEFHRRWSDIQASFVDEPRGAVEQADTLVAEVMQRLAQVFAEERRTLEQQWDKGGDADTEELRLALRRYRSFFDRLLAM
ncbi:MAG TPA: hypothetical protein VGQ62_06040 [Chloroflexota bacterium]|nr:hypothetical protein [Chloroflexota bacterium]